MLCEAFGAQLVSYSPYGLQDLTIFLCTISNENNVAEIILFVVIIVNRVT